MSNVTVNHYWPDTLQAIRVMDDEVDSGSRSTKYESGHEKANTLYDHDLLRVGAKFYLDPSDADFIDNMIWLRWVQGGFNRFWWKDPHKSYNVKRQIGITDGLRTTWSVPLYDPDIIEVYLNGARKTPTEWTDGPNLCSLNQSICNRASGELFGTGVSYDKIRSFDLFTEDAAYVDHLVGSTEVDDMLIGISGLSSREYSAHARAINISGDTYGGVRLKFTTGSAPGRSIWDIDSSLSTSSYEWMSASGTMNYPTENLVKCGYGVEIGNGTGRSAYDALALTHGDLAEWWRGDVDLPVIEFNAGAPASGSIIEVLAFECNVVHKMVADGMKFSKNAFGAVTVSCTLREVAE